jgi:hypothetical protein
LHRKTKTFKLPLASPKIKLIWSKYNIIIFSGYVGHWFYIHGNIAACHVNVSLPGAPQHAIHEQFANYSKIKILSFFLHL